MAWRHCAAEDAARGEKGNLRKMKCGSWKAEIHNEQTLVTLRGELDLELESLLPLASRRRFQVAIFSDDLTSARRASAIHNYKKCSILPRRRTTARKLLFLVERFHPMCLCVRFGVVNVDYTAYSTMYENGSNLFPDSFVQDELILSSSMENITRYYLCLRTSHWASS